MPITEAIQKVILADGTGTGHRGASPPEGVRDLRQSGLVQVRIRVTSLEEVIAATNDNPKAVPPARHRVTMGTAAPRSIGNLFTTGKARTTATKSVRGARCAPAAKPPSAPAQPPGHHGHAYQEVPHQRRQRYLAQGCRRDLHCQMATT